MSKFSREEEATLVTLSRHLIPKGSNEVGMYDWKSEGGIKNGIDRLKLQGFDERLVIEAVSRAELTIPEYVITQDRENEIKDKARECYHKIINAHKHYLDWKGDEIVLQSIWDLATYTYKAFNSFPYRFITAMKGSGKTRLLKLTEALAWQGKLTTGMSDSSLFRAAAENTLIFDESEAIGKKEKSSQRLILNSGYKKGAKIILTQEKVTKEGKRYEPKEFDVYSPKMIANIWGIEEVLGDRCISSILEKSNNPSQTKLIEDFDTNPYFAEIKRTLEAISVGWCSVVLVNKCIEKWNSYITTKYTPTHTTHNTLLYTTIHNLNITEEEQLFFDKIDAINLDGRNLELFFPLLITAQFLGDDILNNLLRIAKEKIHEKKEDDYYVSKDVAVYDFVSRQESSIGLQSITDLFLAFKSFYETADEGTGEVYNVISFGKAITRLNLALDKKRKNRGIEVILDVAKAKEKMKIFKGDEKNEEETENTKTT